MLLLLPLLHAQEDGGAIYVDPNGTIAFNDFATFKENKCYEVGPCRLALVWIP